jgi:hypothetical protein
MERLTLKRERITSIDTYSNCFNLRQFLILCTGASNIHKFYVLPHTLYRIYVFCVDVRKNSEYLHIQVLTDWFS